MAGCQGNRDDYFPMQDARGLAGRNAPFFISHSQLYRLRADLKQSIPISDTYVRHLFQVSISFKYIFQFQNSYRRRVHNAELVMYLYIDCENTEPENKKAKH